jgi:dipeptidyl aminopeptidase/acylaminoacyl peptidase
VRPWNARVVRRGSLHGAVFVIIAVIFLGRSISASAERFAPPLQTDLSADVTPRDMIETADIGGVKIAPNKEYISVRVDRSNVASNTSMARWYVVSLATGKSRYVADGGNTVLGELALPNDDPAWSPDSRWIYFRALHGEELAVWRANVSGESEKLTHDAADVESFKLDAKHKRLFYVVRATREAIKGAESKEYREGVVLTPGDFASEQLFGNLPYDGRLAVMRRQQTGEFRPLLSHAPQRLFVLDLTGKTAHTASASEADNYGKMAGAPALASAPNAPTLVRSASDGRVAFLAPSMAESKDAFGHPDSPLELRWTMSALAPVSNRCRHAACKFATALEWRPHTNEVVFVAQDYYGTGGESGLYAWDVARDTVRKIMSMDGVMGTSGGFMGRLKSSVCPVTAQYAVCSVASASEPPRLQVIDLDAGRQRTILDPNAELRQKHLISAEHLTWPDKWGRIWNGYLTLPRGRPRGELPLVITSYRCNGFLQGGQGGTVPEQVLATNGIAALCVNAANWTGLPHPSGKIPPGQASEMQNVLDSWESAAGWLIERGIVDAKLIGISGHSFSGESVNYAISHSAAFAVAGSAHATCTDPLTYYLVTGEIGDLMHKGYGVPDPQSDAGHYYDQVSAALNVERITAPLLIQSAEGEYRYGVQYISELATHARPAEIVVFPNETHVFWQPSHRWAMQERYIDWFRYWLQNYEDPKPSKADQYARWRELRKLRNQLRDRQSADRPTAAR